MAANPSSRQLTLLWTDLPRQAREVLSGLTAGRNYLLTHEGQELARLVPIQRPVIQQTAFSPYDPQALHKLEALLGETHTSGVLGLSSSTFTRFRSDGILPQAAQDRLGLLSQLVDHLFQVSSRQRVRGWLYRSRGQLHNRSVVLTLCFPWEPGDATILLVQSLVEEDLRRLSLPQELLSPKKRWL